MGALQGTLTYKLFFVQGELEDDFKKTLVENVERRAFEELDAEQPTALTPGEAPPFEEIAAAAYR